MPNPKRPSFATCERLWAKQQGRCAVCGGAMTKQVRDRDTRQKSRAVAMTPNFWTVDHIVPLSKGGSCDESNLQLACGSCNRKKGAR